MTAEAREPILLTSEDDVAVAGFGVATGWAHETPRLRGVTERAMQWLAATPGVEARWQVDALVSYFWVTGSPRAVQIGLGDVLRRATKPPVPAPLTQTDARPDADALALMQRWGLRGFGLQGWQRLGFVTADAADLAAVLSRIGPSTVQLFAVNAQVDAAMVPTTAALAPPDPDFPPVVSPPILFDAQGGFSMSWQVPARDVVAEELVRQAVVEAIEATPGPGQGGAPVGTGAHWLSRRLGTRGSHTAIVVPMGLSDEAMAHLAERLRVWAATGPDEGELERAIGRAHEGRPLGTWDLVRSAVEESLVGRAEEPFEEPTAHSVRQSLRAIRDSLLVGAPEVSTAIRLAPAQIVPEPEPPLAGDSYRYVALIRRGARRRVTVTAGHEGVARSDPAGNTVIRRPAVAAVEHWPGGQLRVTALDGRQLSLDPAELRGGKRLSEQVRDLAPEAVVEHPEAHPASPSLVRAYQQAGGWALTATVLLTPALLLAALLLLGAAADSSPDGNRAEYAVVGLVFAALAALAARRVMRLRRVGRSIGRGPWGGTRRAAGGGVRR